jgi:hypothetical protein
MNPPLQLDVKLLPGWMNVKNPKSYVCVRQTSTRPGEMQFSSAVYKPGAPPPIAVTGEKLIEMCRGMSKGVRGRREISSQFGNCDFGTFGTLAVRGESPAYVQVWVLTNGRDFILITHVCGEEPDPAEAKEANEIAIGTTFK